MWAVRQVSAVLALAVVAASALAAEFQIAAVRGPAGETVHSLDAVGERLVYASCSSSSYRLRATTYGAADEAVVVFGGYAHPVATVAGHFYVRDAVAQTLWRTDGTPAGTTRVSEARALDVRLLECRGEVFYSANQGTGDWSLWRIDDAGRGRKLLSTGDESVIYDVGCVGDRLMLVKASTVVHAFPPALLELLGAIELEGDEVAFGTNVAYVVRTPAETRRFGARRTIARLGDDCASALSATLQAARDRIAARQLSGGGAS